MAKIRVINYEPDYDVVPQAIIWRSLLYFSTVLRPGEDGLDEFKGISFIIGNDLRFDLRIYAGHPPFTVTLYLPAYVTELEDISHTIEVAIKKLLVPKYAVAWRRGEPFVYGQLKRHPNDYLQEPEVRILALKIASQQTSRTASAGLIKKELIKYVELSAMDTKRSKSRNNRELWQQIVKNVIYHWSVKAGLFEKGYAIPVKRGVQVTGKGLKYLESVGFLPAQSEVE